MSHSYDYDFEHDGVKFRAIYCSKSWLVKTSSNRIYADHPDREVAITQAKKVWDYVCVYRCDHIEARKQLGYK